MRLSFSFALFLSKSVMFRQNLLLDVLNGISRVFSRCISMSSYNLLRFDCFIFMAYNTIDSLLAIKGIAVDAHSWYLFDSTFVGWTT